MTTDSKLFPTSTYEGRVLAAVGAVFRQGLTAESEPELVRRCLAVAEELTFSDYGWIGEVTGDGRLDTIALSNAAWEACGMQTNEGSLLVNNMPLRGIWSVVIEREQSLLTNAPADHPSSVGLPDGHPPMSAFIGVPLRCDGRTFGMIALAKREGPFVTEDLEAIEHLSVSVAEALLRHRAVRALEASERELKRSNDELQHFAYVASHDLREPLRKITAFGDLLAQELDGSLSDRAKDYLERMVSGAQRMQVLINDVLALSRVQSSRGSLRPVALQGIVRSVLDDMSSEIASSRAAIEVGPLPVVDADGTQMYQLFQNLIGNALKFRAAGVSPQVVLTSRVDGGECTIEVRDNGIGIDPMHHERIFQLFQRLHPRDEYEGTGLGLALCQRIVRRHGGHFRVDSAVGEGSTFIVCLPCRGTNQDSGPEE